MLRFYLRITLILTLLLMVFSAAMLALGGAQPINPALRGFVEGCEGVERLCWFGIVSGETRLQKAVDIFSSAGYEQVSHELLEIPSAYRDGFISRSNDRCHSVAIVYNPDIENPAIIIGEIQDCPNVYIQDVLGVFGEPQEVLFTQHGGILTFEHSIQAVYRGNLRPHTPVEYVWINYYGENFGGWLFDWRGFYPLWWYCSPLPIAECLPH